MPSPKPRPVTSRSASSSRSSRPATGRSSSGRSSSGRSSSGRSAKSVAGKSARAARRTYSLDPNDPGVVRRAQKKREARRLTGLSLLVVAIVSIPLGMMGWGVWEGYCQARDEKLMPRQALLRDLQAQLQSRQKELRALNTPAGKERALVENGFVRPGERILLFPKDSSISADAVR